jgi:thiamine-phosphate pyrophosphorylase
VVPIGRLHVITDGRPDRDALVVVEAALVAGAPVVQVRAKALSDRALYELTCRVMELCAAQDATCIVNDRVDVALAAGAHGVHVGADDFPVVVARRLLGPGGIVGATARDPETARAHQAAGASYLGVGPCFATSTKKGLPDPIGCAGVRAVSDAVTIPVIAIAGVTAERVPELVASGAYGVAVVGAVWDAVDPHAAVGELVACLDAAA